MVTVHLHNRGVYLHIFTPSDMDFFLFKMCKIDTFFFLF